MQLLKSLLFAAAMGVVIGLVLSAAMMVKGAQIDGKSTLALCGISVLACVLLAIRDNVQEKNVRHNRELNDLGSSNDPWLKSIHADERVSFKPVFGAVTSEYFEIHWVVNSTTMDFNTSILSLTAKKEMTAAKVRQEVNRIAQLYCGGFFLRTQTVCVIIQNASAELKAKSLIATSFMGASGIIWALCVCEANRVVDAAKTPHQVKTDGIYLRLVNWFSEAGYQIIGSEKQPWPLQQTQKGLLDTSLTDPFKNQ